LFPLYRLNGLTVELDFPPVYGHGRSLPGIEILQYFFFFFFEEGAN